MVGFHRWSVSILPLSRRTREDRETVVVSIGGGFEPFLRMVVVSIGRGSMVVWRIGGGLVEDQWWFQSVEDLSVVICVEDRRWFRWVSPLSFERRTREDRTTKCEKKKKKEKKIEKKTLTMRLTRGFKTPLIIDHQTPKLRIGNPSFLFF